MKTIYFGLAIFFLTLVTPTSSILGQTQEVSGTIMDGEGEAVIAATITIKGTYSGVVTDLDGKFTINAASDAILVIRSLGFANQEVPVKGRSSINVTMNPDFQSLDEVTVVGIRASQLKASEAKRDATTVIEAITPADIGSFSDINVADALQRVPGIQIERDLDGVSGDRVSIRGMGPQFVQVTINGRTPLSAGSEGNSQLRHFNLNIIPSEIINGATIYKGVLADQPAAGIAGAVNFETLRPLDANYKKKNYFARVSARSTSNSAIEDFQHSPRISAVFGGKINNELAAYTSIIARRENYLRYESQLRNFQERNIRVDANSNGVFDESEGDIIHENKIVGLTVNNNLLAGTRRQIGASSGIQWRPSDKFDIVLDHTITRVLNDSDRQSHRFILGTGNANGLLGENNFFAPGSVTINGDYVTSMDAAGADLSQVRIQNRATVFDNHTTNNVVGLNMKQKISEKWDIEYDIYYSHLDFFQRLNNVGLSQLDGADYNKSDFSIDYSGEIPHYTFPDEMLDPSLHTLGNTGLRHIRTKGHNYGYSVKASYLITPSTKLFAGLRHSNMDIESRIGSSQIQYTDQQEVDYQQYRVDNPRLTSPEFIQGKTGLSRWLYTPTDYILSLTPEESGVKGGDLFNFSRSLEDTQSEENDLEFNPGRSFGGTELTSSAFLMANTASTLFGHKLSINYGLRVVRTFNEMRGFTAVETNDPFEDSNQSVPLEERLYHETSNSDIQLAPSINVNLNIKGRIQYRLGLSRTASRPRFVDLRPNNLITFISPNSPIFNEFSQSYEPDLGNSVYRGTIVSGNPDLKPYSAWSFDNTLEYYSDFDGVFVVSAYYKHLVNYIGFSTLFDQAYPGVDALGIAAPEGQEDLLFDITKPVNATDGYVYGFELGFNQHFSFLPGFLSGFGLRANYTFVESGFDFAESDAENGLPGSSRDNVNAVLYYEKSGITVRGTMSHRGQYLSNLGGLGNSRADESHYTDAITRFGVNVGYKIRRGMKVSAGVSNLTGADLRRYIDNDPRNMIAYYGRDPFYNVAISYKL